MNPSSLIVCQDVAFEAGGRRILSLPQWSLPQGEHCVITGLSGSGKTTLLHLLAGLLTPTAGSIRILDKDMTAMHERERDRFRGAHIGMVFQTLHLLPSLNVEKNLELAAFATDRKRDASRLEAVLQRLDLLPLKHAMPGMLSQGEKQRVAIARALINKPALLLADEPTSALDDVRCEAVIALLKEQADTTGATLVMATHDSRVIPHFKHQLHLVEPS